MAINPLNFRFEYHNYISIADNTNPRHWLINKPDIRLTTND